MFVCVFACACVCTCAGGRGSPGYVLSPCHVNDSCFNLEISHFSHVDESDWDHTYVHHATKMDRFLPILSLQEHTIVLQLRNRDTEHTAVRVVQTNMCGGGICVRYV